MLKDRGPEGRPTKYTDSKLMCSEPGSRMLWLQSGGCIYNCRHPLWSGEGRCQAQMDDASKYECLCDPGYISIDSFGNPSCVPSGVLIGVYFCIALTEFLAFAFLFRSWREERRLPMMLRMTRRSDIRRRLIAAVGFWCGSSSIVFGIAAGHARREGLFGCGMLQVLYAFCMPSLVVAVGNVMELWVDSLPSQMMPSGSFTLKMKNVAENHKLFGYIGLFAMVGMGIVGISTFFFLDTLYAARAINIALAGSAGCGIICVNSVGVMLTLVINRATKTASPFAKIFYAHSIKTLWGKIFFLSATAASWISTVLVQELTLAGGGTPVLILIAMMSSSTVGLTMSVQFSERKPLRFSSARRTTPGPAKEFFGEGPAANPPEAYDSETQDDKSQTYESFPVTLWFINAARRLSWKGSTQTAHPHAVVPVSDGGEGI